MLNFPAAVLIMNEIMLTISNFKLFDTGKDIDPYLYYLPEEDAFSESFEICSYDSNLLLKNASRTIWIYKVHLAMMLLMTALIWCLNRTCKNRCKNCKNKVMDFFYWNGLIHLFMETSFEMALVAVLNMHKVDWNTPFRAVRYSAALSIISLIILGGIPILLTVLYCKNFSMLKDQSFKSKYGSGYAATNFDVTNP